ncbi:hypothetical protein P692DRAFT_20840547, partial [Suillus brevipes Sb2]
MLVKGFVLSVAVFVLCSTQLMLFSGWGNHFQIQCMGTCYKVDDAKGSKALITTTK